MTKINPDWSLMFWCVSGCAAEATAFMGWLKLTVALFAVFIVATAVCIWVATR